MNYNKILKKTPFPVGFYSICGPQGAGKTSGAVGFFRTDYKLWRKWRYERGLEAAKEYYAANGIKLHVDKVLYFSNTPILLDRKRKIYTHEIDIQQLGLPNDKYDVQYLPRGSVVFIQEADVLAYCRDWVSLSEYLRALLKYVRHNLLTIIFDMQVGGDLDKALRNLTMGTFYMIDSGVKRFLLFWKRQEWRFLYVQSQFNNAIKEYSQLGCRSHFKAVERGKFHVWGNVFDCYDSFSGRRYFFYGIEKHGYTYKEFDSGSMRVSDINDFVKNHPLSRPDEVKKK